VCSYFVFAFLKARNMGILFDLLENRYDADKLKFEVLTQDLPLQPNL